MVYLRAGPTWMRRGTPGDVAAPRGPTRRLRGKVTCANMYIYIFYIIYKYNVQPSVYRKGIQPSEIVAPFKSVLSFNLSRVGLKFHTVFL